MRSRTGESRRDRRSESLRSIGLALAVAVVLVVTGCTSGGSHRGNIAPTTTGREAASPAPPTTAAGPRQVDPSLFETGSCVAFPPTAGDRHAMVFLDAGHGGLDPGAVGHTQAGETVHEADQTLPVALDTMALLRADGFDVTMSRTQASAVARPQPGDISGGLYTVQGDHRDLVARDLCADMAKADVLVGIYFDAGGSTSNAGSITGYDPDRSFSAQNLRLAKMVQSNVLEAMNAQGWGIPDQGVVSDTTLGGPALSSAGAQYGHLVLLGPADPGYVDNPSQMPGALIEPLYITDPFEASIAASAAGQKVIATGLAAAIKAYFGTPAGGS